MSKHFSTNSRTSTTRLFFTICLGGGLALLGISSFRRPAPLNVSAVENQKVERREEMIRPGGQVLQGAEARKYLQQPGEGQSLMQAITAARFGLKSQERGPFGEPGRGYLGMSHDQNLNAWFAEDGVTVRPTVAEEERARAWHLEMRLKAYGYGTDLIAAPPIVSQHVKDNRIEYERGNFELRNANFESMKSDLSFISQSAFRNPQFVEWYENRAEGIEQGFTIAQRPERNNAIVSGQPLRLVISLSGDLRAREKNGGQAIELTDSEGKPVLSYSKLTAVDATGKHLAAHLETNDGGSDFALVVDDREASYPIVIDPIVATVEKVLDAGNLRQTGAQFGDAVAIGFAGTFDQPVPVAIVGAWLEDTAGLDNGAVYLVSRPDTGWITPIRVLPPSTLETGERCGYSVAINNRNSDLGITVAFGCPGANSNTGKAFKYHVGVGKLNEIVPPAGTNYRDIGDFFGASIAMSTTTDRHEYIAVGAPLHDVGKNSNVGAIHIFENVDDGASPVWRQSDSGDAIPNAQLGTNVAMDGADIAVSLPGDRFGRVDVYTKNSNNDWSRLANKLAAGDGQAGDLFGETVAINGNTIVVSAAGDDDKGTDAGAAYVFVRDANGLWSQQQKLTASDGRADDIFSYYAVAVERNMIVVGARRNDGVSANINDNRGAAYVFARTGDVWTQQSKITAPAFFGAPGDEFGTSVCFLENTVLVGSGHAAASDGTSNTGAAYVYRLNCVPPSSARATITGGGAVKLSQFDACPGALIDLTATYRDGGVPTASFQWRKNGVNIAGASGATYRIASLSVSDAGVYDAVVSNSCGAEVSSPATLGVYNFNINPLSQNLGASGSTGVVTVNLTGNCPSSPWTAVSESPSIITVTSGANSTGNGAVGFTVSANTGPVQRTGTLTIAGKTFTVTQDAAAPTPTPNVVQFSASNYGVQEDCTTVTITVNRIGDTSGPASVDYNTSDVTATERKDYITALGSLRFAAGETSKSFAVLINEDSFVEGNETFSISLSNPSGVTLGGPAIATVTITDDASESAANAIDDPQTYVCQHYHDFLNRQPDASGLQFWTSQITSCGTDQACIEARRINVSASFFLSIEFQDTGYLVERIYKAAYGDAVGNSTFPSSHQLPVPVVRLNEFLSDTQEIGLGVIVGQGNWQQQIENNKQAVTAAFVQRGRFTTAFPNSMTAAQFVDTLNANAGNPLSAAERNQLVNDLSTNAKTRAQVLRAVAEDPDLNSAESNRAFVLMQYFGYLRRNPNDPQDSDHTGYDFWLTKLNQFNGNYINAEMVRAFITSIEYRQRFGQQ